MFNEVIFLSATYIMDINDSILNIKFFINNCVQGASRVLNPSHAPCKFRYNSFDRKKFDNKFVWQFVFLISCQTNLLPTL